MFIWTIQDAIGLIVLGLFAAFFVILFLLLFVLRTIDNAKTWWKKKWGKE